MHNITARLNISNAKFIWSTLYAVGEAFLNGAPLGVIYAVLITLLSPSAPSFNVTIAIVMLLACFTIQAFCSIRSHKLVCEYAFELGSRIRIALGEHLRKLPLGTIFSRDSGHNVETLLLDVTNVELTASHIYNKILSCIAVPAMIAVIMLFINPFMVLLLLSTLPPALIFLYLSHKKMDMLGGRMLTARKDSTARIIEYIHGIQTFKTLNITGRAFSRLTNTLQHLTSNSIRFESFIWPVTELYAFTASLGIVCILYVGGTHFIEGSLPLFQFLLFMLVALRFYIPINSVGPYISTLSYLKHSADNIDALLSSPEQTGSITSFPQDFESIAFRNVSFAHGSKQILRDLSFTAGQGTVTALVGPSGAGKTTIANLLIRFWDRQSGTITIGGTDTQNISPDTILQNVSLVMQDAYLFNDTVLENLKMARETATESEIMQAVEAARCKDFIDRLPRGIHTCIGENGALLSGGERKRLSIARAILRDAPILILDEATAALDTENERLVQQAFSAVGKGKTVFIIAQRLSTVRNADQILFIEQGQIAEQGTFSELLKLNGRFAHFWNLQHAISQWKLRRSNDCEASAA